MQLELLVSCMHNDNFQIINKSNIHCDTLVINQTDNSHYEEKRNGEYTLRRIDTIERGLSKSRNMALKNAVGDICLVCDDDELFVDNLKIKIEEQYKLIPDADIIVFKMKNRPSKLKNKTYELSLLDTLCVSSWQITFKKDSIKKADIWFDEKLGSGTGNGAGEENKFLLDAKKAGLKIYYVPTEIGLVAQSESQWFDGYNEKYFYQRGQTTRYLLGFLLSTFYAFYFVKVNKNIIKKEFSLLKALKFLLKGIIDNNLGKVI